MRLLSVGLKWICVDGRYLALAGAAATVSSDALMNPFDGTSPLPVSPNLLKRADSHQTTHANPQLTSSNRLLLRSIRLRRRGSQRILRLLPDHTHNERPFHRCPILRLRITQDVVESRWNV